MPGKVLAIDTGQRYVHAGAVLAELDPAPYRAALTRARAKAAAAAARVRAAQQVVAGDERTAAAGVTAALGSTGTMPAPVRMTPGPPPAVNVGAAARVQAAPRQLVIARSEGLTDVQSQAASAQQRLARDRALLAQGLIAARQVTTDTAAYNAAKARLEHRSPFAL